MSDFTYVPSYTSDVTDQYAVSRADFGDGYVATAPDGINAVKEVWRLLFENAKLTDGNAIRAFLKGKAGATFTWTPPGGSEKRWRLLGDVAMPRTGPTTVNLTCTFEESFGV